jgi:Sortase domain
MKHRGVADPGSDGVPRRTAPGHSVAVIAAAALAVLLVLTGIVVLVSSGSHGSGKPHAQPLPAQTFELAPQQARAVAAPAALTVPQQGSIQHQCKPLADEVPQVIIGSLCIYAPTVPTEVVDNSLIIPTDVHQVGLDTDSAAMSAKQGTTIIAGHVDDIHQGEGVFYYLHQIKPGADITVMSGGGTKATSHWRVYKTQVAHKTALPRDIWSTTGPRRLVLVTCGGPLLATESGNTYEDNVLVYATPAEDAS